MATSWGTRKALGRRYGQDPALLMEVERLQREYDLAPGREARAVQASQFDRSLAQQQSQFEENQSNAKAAGITGTIANLGTTGLMMRGLTKGKDEPFFGKTLTGMWDKAWGNTPAVATPGMTQPVAGYNFTAPTGIPSASNPSFWTNPQAGTAPLAVNPALIDATQSGIAAGADVGMGAGTAAAAPSAWSTYGVPGTQALGLYEGSRMAGNQFGENTFANRTLSNPVTGWNSELLRGAGKLTGIKQFDQAADQLNRWEKDIIQKPIDAVVDFISDPIGGISDMFGW